MPTSSMTDTWTSEIVAVHQLRDAARTVLQAWLPTALHDVAGQAGVDVPPSPRTWRRVATFDQVPEAQVPVVFVAAPSTTSTTLRRSTDYTASWELQVVAALRGRDYEQTAERVSVYAAAIRAVMLQRPLGINVAAVRWQGEVYDEMPAVAQRTWAAAMLSFEVDVAPAVQIYTPMRAALAPPADPSDTPDGTTATDVAAVVDVVRGGVAVPTVGYMRIYSDIYQVDPGGSV